MQADCCRAVIFGIPLFTREVKTWRNIHLVCKVPLIVWQVDDEEGEEEEESSFISLEILKKIALCHYFDLCNRQKAKGDENRQQIYNYTTVSWKYTLEEL